MFILFQGWCNPGVLARYLLCGSSLPTSHLPALTSSLLSYSTPHPLHPQARLKHWKIWHSILERSLKGEIRGSLLNKLLFWANPSCDASPLSHCIFFSVPYVLTLGDNVQNCIQLFNVHCHKSLLGTGVTAFVRNSSEVSLLPSSQCYLNY